MRRPRIGLGAALVLIVWVALGLAAWRWLFVGNKVEYCRRRAQFHLAMERECRDAAESLGVSPEEAAEIRRVAAMHALIARKYLRVVDRPWRPYPKAPLVTPEEDRALGGP